MGVPPPVEGKLAWKLDGSEIFVIILCTRYRKMHTPRAARVVGGEGGSVPVFFGLKGCVFWLLCHQYIATSAYILFYTRYIACLAAPYTRTYSFGFGHAQRKRPHACPAPPPSLLHLRCSVQFCDHLACDSHHRPLVPPAEGKGAGRRHPIPGSVGDSRGGMGMPKAFLIAVLVVGLIIWYTSMAIGQRSRWTRKDLRPLPRRARVSGREDSGGRSTSVRGSSGLRRRGLSSQALG